MNRVFTLGLLLSSLLSIEISRAQTSRKDRYDSMVVGDRITPAVSSVMMPKSFTEVLLSTSLATTNTLFTDDRKTFDQQNRYTALGYILQVTHGLSKSGRFNAGVDLVYRIARADADRNSSPTAVFGNSNEGLIQYGRGFTSVGIRARYIPTQNRNFVIQHAVYIPISSSSTDSRFLGDNRYAFNTQFLYTQLLGRKLFLFGQTDVLVRFKDDDRDTDFTNPINVFGTFLLTKHIFPFVQLGLVNGWGNEFDHLYQSYSYGIGLQYQFNSMFNLNAFYNDVFAGKNINQWNNFNFGIRVVL